MLEEKLLQLDQKVMSLLAELRRTREEALTLRGEVEKLRPQAAEAAKLREENAAQREKMATLEKESSDRTGREQEFRERLRVIIEKIDALEKTGEE